MQLVISYSQSSFCVVPDESLGVLRHYNFSSLRTLLYLTVFFDAHGTLTGTLAFGSQTVLYSITAYRH